MKKALIFMIFLVCVIISGFSQTSNIWTVNNMATWIEAVNGIRSGGNNKEYMIIVNGNVSIPASNDNTFGSNTNITISLEGNGTLSLSANGNLLFIGTDQTIIAKDLTLQGNANNTSAVVNIKSKGTFYMEGAVEVTGNKGNGVNIEPNYRNSATFIMNGGSISGNNGYGVAIDRYGSGTFTMNSGTISSNAKSGVHLNSEGIKTFIMNDGTISNNTGNGVEIHYGNLGKITFTMRGGNISDNRNGGIHNDDGVITMYGGTIANNSARNGGGVNNNGTFTMHGGTISNNSANNGGGVINTDTFTMHSGTISNNTANYGGGVCISRGTFSMRGNSSITGNNARNSGGGVYLGSANSTNYIRYILIIEEDALLFGNTAHNAGGGVYISDNRGTFIMRGGTLSNNISSNQGGGVYNGGNFTKLNGIIYGNDEIQELRNIANSMKGHAVYQSNNGGWRNATAKSTMNTDSYGFWLNEEE